jgi:hypothetical protein
LETAHRLYTRKGKLFKNKNKNKNTKIPNIANIVLEEFFGFG